MKKYLITGGAGFIGSHLADKLIEKGCQVAIIDNLSTGKKENLNPKAVFYHADICDFEKITPFFSGIDGVFHLAAIPRVPISVEDPILTTKVNVLGTVNVFKAAADKGATAAATTPVRLPGAVEPLFVEWIRRTFPDRAEKVLNRIRDIHEGKLNDSRFGSRMSGKGKIADMMRDLFDLNAARYGLDKGWEELTTKHFLREESGQGELF